MKVRIFLIWMHRQTVCRYLCHSRVSWWAPRKKDQPAWSNNSLFFGSSKSSSRSTRLSLSLKKINKREGKPMLSFSLDIPLLFFVAAAAYHAQECMLKETKEKREKKGQRIWDKSRGSINASTIFSCSFLYSNRIRRIAAFRRLAIHMWKLFIDRNLVTCPGCNTDIKLYFFGQEKSGSGRVERFLGQHWSLPGIVPVLINSLRDRSASEERVY